MINWPGVGADVRVSLQVITMHETREGVFLVLLVGARGGASILGGSVAVRV